MRHTLRSWLVAAGQASLAGLALVSGCGGGGGDGAATAPAALAGPPVLDAARAGSATLGPAGGTVQATAANGVQYTLTVPPFALTDAVAIRMTPITDVGQPALAAGVTGAVQFEPTGLRFLVAASLRITADGITAVPASGTRQVGFSTANDGSGMQLTVPTTANGRVDLLVPHFSTAGAAQWTPVQLELVPLSPTSPTPQQLADPYFWNNQLARMVDASPAAIAAVFTRWLDEFVNPTLARSAAATPDFDNTTEANSAYSAWSGFLNSTAAMIGADRAAQLRALLAPAQARTQSVLAGVLLAHINNQLVPCPANATVATLSGPSHFQQEARRHGMDTVALGLDRASFLRKVNDCLRPVLDPVTLPNPLNVGQPISLDARAQVVFVGRPDPVGVPFEFTIIPSNATVATPVGASDAAGRFTTVVTPSSAQATFNVRACLILPLLGDEHSDICVVRSGSPLEVPPAGAYTGSYVVVSRNRSDRFCGIGGTGDISPLVITNGPIQRNATVTRHPDGELSFQVTLPSRAGPITDNTLVGFFRPQADGSFTGTLRPDVGSFRGAFTDTTFDVTFTLPGGQTLCVTRFTGTRS